MTDIPRIVVLISGSGSNLQALIDATASNTLDAEISAVISNRPGVLGLQRAEKADIPTHLLDHSQYQDRDQFDAELIRLIDQYQPDLVVLAGFMRFLTPAFVRHYLGRMLNIHPSLLPKYKGLHTHQRALEAGDRQHGVTVHFVTEELDGGPPIIQAVVPVKELDTLQTLAQRVLRQEHIIYPMAVNWFIEGRLQLQDNRVHLDGQPLPLQGCRLDTTEAATEEIPMS